MQLVRSSATVGDTNVEALYYLAISSARETIELTAAYFVPRPAFTEALCSAAERGVAVRILVPGPHIDKGLVRVAGRAAYDELLEAGVRLFEYQPTMLHAKSLCVDGTWSSVGTVNFDNRSFQLHDEVTSCVWDERFAGELRRRSSTTSSAPRRSTPGAGTAGARCSASARRRRRCSGASSERRPYPALVSRTRRRPPRSRALGPRSLFARRRRHPVLAALGDADQALLRFLRTRGHPGADRDGRSRRSAWRASTARSGSRSAAIGASIDERRRGQWLVAGGLRTGGDRGQLRGQASRSAAQRPLIEEHPPLARGADQALVPVRARDLLGRRGDRPRTGRAAGTPLPVRPRGRDLRRPPLPRHALPVRRARRRRARALLGRLVPGLGGPPAEERLLELAVDANERAQATRRAEGNGARSPRWRPRVGGVRRSGRRPGVKIGIVGLPNAGKSTLFNALTRAGAETGDYAFTTIDPNVAIVPIPDPPAGSSRRDARLERGRARDDRVQRHRRARPRRLAGRGPGQPVPRRDPRDRGDLPRRPLPRERRGVPIPRAGSTRSTTSS